MTEPSVKKIRLTISIPESLLKRVDTVLKESFISRTQFVLTATKEKVEKEEVKKDMLFK